MTIHCRIRIIFVTVLLNALPALAAPQPDSILLDDAEASLLQLSGDEQEKSQFSRVPVEKQPFNRAVELKVADGVDKYWGTSLSYDLREPITKGDTLLATFSLRCTESPTGECQVQFDFGENIGPYAKSVRQVVYAPDGWKSFHIPFTASKDYPAGGSRLGLRMGFRRQSIQVGGLRLERYDSDVSLAELPRSRQTYAGMESDAPWRAAADARINNLRKGDLTVTVLDADGKPVEGAQVNVVMTRHAFTFGSAVTADLLTRSDTTAKKYRAMVARLFNEVVFENDLKWKKHRQGSDGRIDASLNWLAEHGITARGTTLIWPGWRHTPKGTEALKDNPNALRTAIEKRITTTASRWRGRLVDWDVTNETYTNHQLQDVLGKDSVAEWFELARAADPHANLYINDYGILNARVKDSPHQRSYFEQISRLQEAGAPLEGIGVQSHFSAQLTAPERLLEITDRFASFGLPIKVTEFDFTTEDLELQAAYLRDFYTTMFSHEAIEGILMWGFWSESHPRPKAALFDANFQPRPHAIAYENLVLRDWWTDETAITDNNGEATIRGFLGEHEVSVTVAGETTAATATLEHGGSTLTIHQDH